VARSRSGTRGSGGPRKPPRRDGAFASGAVQVADPRERGAIELPGTITVKELAELLGVNPADIIREMIKSGIFATINLWSIATRRRWSPASSATRFAEAVQAAARMAPTATPRVGRRGDQGGPLRGGRPVVVAAARPDR
jgi:hypothetical protein